MCETSIFLKSFLMQIWCKKVTLQKSNYRKINFFDFCKCYIKILFHIIIQTVVVNALAFNEAIIGSIKINDFKRKIFVFILSNNIEKNLRNPVKHHLECMGPVQQTDIIGVTTVFKKNLIHKLPLKKQKKSILNVATACYIFV